ncbi:MAG: hypothetical protein ABSD81_02055 [Methanomicrobiales archaeon]|jgi:hypothetical protein
MIGRRHDKENGVNLKRVRHSKVDILGWTQEEIGEAVGKDKAIISRRLCDLEELLKVIKSEYIKGQTIEEMSKGSPHAHRPSRILHNSRAPSRTG